MKKRFLRSFVALTFLVAVTLPSCEFLEDCGTCTMFTEYSDGTIDENAALYVCGDLYAKYSSSTPTTLLGTTTWWVCD